MCLLQLQYPSLRHSLVTQSSSQLHSSYLCYFCLCGRQAALSSSSFTSSATLSLTRTLLLVIISFSVNSICLRDLFCCWSSCAFADISIRTKERCGRVEKNEAEEEEWISEAWWLHLQTSETCENKLVHWVSSNEKWQRATSCNFTSPVLFHFFGHICRRRDVERVQIHSAMCVTFRLVTCQSSTNAEWT